MYKDNQVISVLSKIVLIYGDVVMVMGGALPNRNMYYKSNETLTISFARSWLSES